MAQCDTAQGMQHVVQNGMQRRTARSAEWHAAQNGRSAACSVVQTSEKSTYGGCIRPGTVRTGGMAII